MSSSPHFQSSTARVHRRGERGLTLVELIVAAAILSLLAGMAVPLARYKVRRQKEQELRLALRDMRTAIDKYKDLADSGRLGPVKLGTEGYPETLEILVEGIKLGDSADGKKVRFLRRLPRDPFTNNTDWGKRSVQDDPKSMSWGGQNVFDVFSKTYEKAPDGTRYTDW
jgi:general secretion pathway protein G